jgi:hypothetical protein
MQLKSAPLCASAFLSYVSIETDNLSMPSSPGGLGGQTTLFHVGEDRGWGTQGRRRKQKRMLSAFLGLDDLRAQIAELSLQFILVACATSD